MKLNVGVQGTSSETLGLPLSIVSEPNSLPNSDENLLEEGWYQSSTTFRASRARCPAIRRCWKTWCAPLSNKGANIPTKTFTPVRKKHMVTAWFASPDCCWIWIECLHPNSRNRANHSIGLIWKERSTNSQIGDSWTFKWYVPSFTPIIYCPAVAQWLVRWPTRVRNRPLYHPIPTFSLFL